METKNRVKIAVVLLLIVSIIGIIFFSASLASISYDEVVLSDEQRDYSYSQSNNILIGSLESNNELLHQSNYNFKFATHVGSNMYGYLDSSMKDIVLEDHVGDITTCMDDRTYNYVLKPTNDAGLNFLTGIGCQLELSDEPGRYRCSHDYTKIIEDYEVKCYASVRIGGTCSGTSCVVIDLGKIQGIPELESNQLNCKVDLKTSPVWGQNDISDYDILWPGTSVEWELNVEPECLGGSKCETYEYSECNQFYEWDNQGIVMTKCGVTCLKDTYCTPFGVPEKDYYCEDNNKVYEDRTDECINYQCVTSYETIIEETCDFICEDGVCIDMAQPSTPPSINFIEMLYQIIIWIQGGE